MKRTRCRCTGSASDQFTDDRGGSWWGRPATARCALCGYRVGLYPWGSGRQLGQGPTGWRLKTHYVMSIARQGVRYKIMERDGDLTKLLQENKKAAEEAEARGDEIKLAECHAMCLYEQLNARSGMWEGR